MPRWLWQWLLGVVTFTQRVDETRDGTVHINLLVTHPLFGEIFGYTGTFQTTRTHDEAAAPS
jgi:hypothetical protein